MDEVDEFLSRLSHTLGNVNTMRVDFIQKRRMAAFNDPLTATGTCYFRAPGRLRWEVLEPYRSALVFNRGKVAKFVYDADQFRKTQLGDRDVLKQLLSFICLWIQGDFAASRNLFETRVELDHGPRLHLTPRSRPLKDMIRKITLTLNRTSMHMRSVEICETRGDRIEITFLREQWNGMLDDALFATGPSRTE